MTFSPGDLGDLEKIARALGLVTDAGFNNDWLSRPGHYLGSMLAEQQQRDAVIDVIDELLGGSARETDMRGQIWLPLFESLDPPVAFFAVVDEQPSDHIRIGVGVKVEATVPEAAARLHVPLFKAAKSGQSIGDPLLLGQPGGTIDFTCDITVDPAPAVPGQAHLRAVGLSLNIPTHPSGGAPWLGIAITGLQLPGATAPRDIVLSLANLSELDDIVLELVLGLIEAQARQAGTPVQAFAELIGLSAGGAIPALPLNQLAERGLNAIGDWAASVFNSNTARDAWLDALSRLLANGATVIAGRVSLPLGIATVTIGIDATSGAGGLPVITPIMGIETGNGQAVARFEAKLFSLDLGTRTAVALPALEAYGLFGRTPSNNTPLVTGGPAEVDSIRFGLSLDQNRRPVATLALINVKIGAHPVYPVLDLSSPGAVLEAAGQVIGDVLDEVLAALGPAQAAIRTLLGLSVPAGIPGLPATNIATFLGDPLGAIRSYWRELVVNHGQGVPLVLAPLRDLIADSAVVASAVTGAGTTADPWTFTLAGPLRLRAIKDAAADRLEISLAAAFMQDVLGERCTRLDADVEIGLITIDLTGGPCTFLSAITAGISGRPRGARRAVIDLPPLSLSADSVGLAANWTPVGGLKINLSAPNPEASINSVSLPLDIPDLSQGFAGLSDRQWDAVEFLAGQLAQLTPVSWVADVVDALGWVHTAPNVPARHRLRLSQLITTPEAALVDWLNGVVLQQASRIEGLVASLARVLTGTAGSTGMLYGSGRPADPYRMPCAVIPGTPEFTAWFEPDGPALGFFTAATERLRTWRPGMTGLSASELADAMIRDMRAGPDIAAFLSGRGDLAAGLADLAERWTNTDGRILASSTAAAGIGVHVVEEAFPLLSEAFGIDEVLSSSAAISIRVVVAASATEVPFIGVPTGRIIDLTTPGLAPNAFVVPSAATGEWVIVLGPRSACRMGATDPDGVAGQTARLERVLQPFRTLAGGLLLVAEGSAGFAARRAAQSIPEVTALVTLGTPLGPVAFSVLTAEPAASALRLLHALVPVEEDDAPFDEDLRLGRDLVAGFMALSEAPALADELAPPADAAAAPRAGLEVHAVFGQLSAEQVLRALTALVAAGLSTRAQTRADTPHVVTGFGAGISVPIALGATGVVVRGHASVELFGADFTGVPSIRTAQMLLVHLEIRRLDGWLVGGPGSTGGHDLRWLEFNMHLPLGSSGVAFAEVILHEPRVFTIRRERWIVRHAGAATDGGEVVTTNLPEVSVLLSGALRELSLSVDPQVAVALQLLEACGVFTRAAGGGFVAAGLDSILHQPDLHFRALIEGSARPLVQTALNTIIAPASGFSIDLAQRSASISLAGTPGTVGLLPWSIAASTSVVGGVSGQLRLGAEGECLRITLNPLTATLERPRAGQATPAIIPVWPTLDVSQLVAELPALLIASAVRLGLDYLRALDAAAKPIIDAVLDGLGLLTGTGADATRLVRVPPAFLSDPAGYLTGPLAFGAPGGVSVAKAIAFVDALKPLLGLAGGPGAIDLAPGASISVAGTGGALRLGVSLNGAALTAPAGNPPRLSFGGTFGLEIAGNGTLRPAAEVFAGLPGAATGRQAVHLVVANGVQLFVRPTTGSDIGLYPTGPGLGGVASTALQVLPFALDQVAGLTTPGAAQTAAQIVSAIGDALDLRTGGSFDGTKLEAWADNPAQRFADRLPFLVQSALPPLATAISGALPAGVALSASGNQILLDAGPFTMDFSTSPFTVGLHIDATGVPIAETITADLVFDQNGLSSFTGSAGPATIPVGDIALKPFVSFAAGNAPVGGARIEVGSATDATGADTVFARWNITQDTFALVAETSAGESSDPEDVALALVRIALDLVARFAMQQQAVRDLLDLSVPNTTTPNVKVQTLFEGVFLQQGAIPPALDPALFDVNSLLVRFRKLLENVARAGPSIDVGGGLAVGALLDGSTVKLTLGVNGRITIVDSDVTVAIEADSRWIVGAGARPAGLAIGFLDIGGGTFEFKPSISVIGIGVRVGRGSGPLLDSVVKLGSVAAHIFADISDANFSGGVQLQLSDLAVGAGGASGGNPIAQGILGDTGSGSNALAPAFSPALAVQKHAGGPVLVSLRAGEGDGPWWLSIQKGFGPLYVEQVGFGVTVRQDQLEKISVLFDGRVSIAGLVAAVDDLQITFTVTSGASLFDASKWAVGLAGLAVTADIAGVTLAGGLRKFGTEPDVEYVGMLMARVATYGLSIYGGYGSAVSDGQRFTAFFAFGAITGPFGGPPAFFLTGIGGGFGINRDLIFPGSLQTFADFVMIRALDPAASASPDPMQELISVRNTFPIKRDRFWFAAGISFTSFALVDGVAVVAVSFGDGFELTLLGLARMALPRPQLRLVSIELGLIVRFSTRDGVMWIQAELTENSWLLHESVRLTGGFAFVTWFKGEHAGEFVLTLGGYHPNFHRNGYPQVPRLGFRWQATSNITIKGENYFALTSEALMAGGALEASADFGAAWARVSFGANAIIYFDPFRYEADAHARIAAGVTIDLWLGEVTISVSLGARIAIAGPDFHGSVTFEVGPIDLTVRFGGSDANRWEPISWDAFVNKYLEADSPGVARTLTAVTGRGSIAPGTGSNGEESGPADGSEAKPFEVFSEFELTVTAMAPATRLIAGAINRPVTPSGLLGIAPVGAAAMSSVITLKLFPKSGGADRIGALRLASTSTGSFPVGAWGPVQSREDKKIPQGEVIDALNGALLVAEARLEDRLPAEVDYNQVESGPRHPLPFVTEKDDRARVRAGAKELVDLLPSNPSVGDIYATAKPWLAAGGNSPLAIAAFRGERAAPPMLGALGERMIAQTPVSNVGFTKADGPRRFDHTVMAPRAIGIFSPLARREQKVMRTTVKDSGIARSLPPTLRDADALVAAGLPAKLLRAAPRAVQNGETLLAGRSVPLTLQARMAPAASLRRGADSAAVARLKSLSAGFLRPLPRGRAAAGDATLLPGELAVLAMPNAKRDSGEGGRPVLQFKGQARITMLGAGGAILADISGQRGVPKIVQGTERIAVWAGAAGEAATASGLVGWLEGQSIAYVGWSTSLCGGGSVYAENAKLRSGPESFTTGWISAKEFVADSRLIRTRFSSPAATLVLVLDEAIGEASDFSLSLNGADIADGQKGAKLDPVLLSRGPRQTLVYALQPGKAAFTVEILRDGGLQVAGVMASPAAPDVVAAQLTGLSADALLEAPLSNPGSGTVISFVEGGR